MNKDRLYKIQRDIANRAIVEDDFERLETVAGVDQAFIGDKIISGIVVLNLRSHNPLERVYSVMKADFPYIPGLLAFREGPAVIDCFSKLNEKPNMLMVDGCGINHPRFAGLATHVGVSLDIPTIGVSKNLLCGSYKHIPERVNDFSIISYEEREVGVIFKSKRGCKPIIVAPGHRVSLETAADIVRLCLTKYKLPEPTRQADRYVNSVKREIISDNEIDWST